MFSFANLHEQLKYGSFSKERNVCVLGLSKNEVLKIITLNTYLPYMYTYYCLNSGAPKMQNVTGETSTE